MTNYRGRHNYAEELKIEDRSIKGNKSMREEVKGFYQKLYEEEFRSRHRFDDLQSKELDEISKSNLEEFSKEEI